jgi:hypothetical protein
MQKEKKQILNSASEKNQNEKELPDECFRSQNKNKKQIIINSMKSNTENTSSSEEEEPILVTYRKKTLQKKLKPLIFQFGSEEAKKYEEEDF